MSGGVTTTNTLSGVGLPREHALSEHGFLAISALLFIASTAATVVWCNAMPAMSKMPMAWMPMCGQTWWGFAASFIGMWTVMMAAMMLLSLLPTLRQYRSALHPAGEPNVDTQTALADAGYFAVQTLTGVMVFALGTALAQSEMTWPVVTCVAPLARGTVVLAAGALQFSARKARQRAWCRVAWAPDCAWRFSLDLGVRCVASCAGLTAILLVTDVMDVYAMVAVSTAITLERLAPTGQRVARCIGAAAVGAGLLLMLRATLP